MKFTARIKRSKGPKLSGLTAGQLNGNQLLTLTVEANKVYYVMVEEGLGFLLMESIPADDAWPALAKLRKTGAK